MPRNHVSVKTLFMVLGFAAMMLLTACSGGESFNPWETPNATPTTSQLPPGQVQPHTIPGADTAAPVSPVGKTAKVAILVPLSGKGSEAGQDMLNAAQLALFDLGDNSFELMPRDTLGTPEGARNATEAAIRDGAQLLLGPVFAADVRAASPVAMGGNKSVIAFSTDWTVANSSTFIMSFLPHTQVKRVLEYASTRGITRVALIAPNDAYGNVVAAAFDSTARKQGMTAVASIRFNSAGAVTPDQLRPLMATNGAAPVQAVLIAADPSKSASISALLTQQGLTPALVKRMGTGLWDDPSAFTQTELQGAWYAASSPAQRATFENNYQKTYGKKPLRIASLAYDATALAAVLAKSGQGYDRSAILNPNGFSGIDGIFRFRPDGLVDRGLAILEIRSGTAVTVDDSPRTFQSSSAQ